MQTQWTRGEYEISTDTHRLDVDAIHRFLTNESYWAAGISREIVLRAIEHSLCFGVYHRTVQVGFCRAVTDQATFALISDVFIVTDHRGKGLSKWMMQCVIGHEHLQGLRRLLLTTSDAHGLYRQFGFTEIGSPARFMEIHRPGMYRSA